jgi:hypothetical protein
MSYLRNSYSSMEAYFGSSYRRPLSVCTKTGNPSIYAYGSIYIGYEYPIPFLGWGTDGSIAARTATEYAAVKSGSPSVWQDIDDITGYKLFVLGDIGGQAYDLWGRNCSNATGDYGSSFASVQVSGWAAGRPRLVAIPTSAEVRDGPLAADINFRTMIPYCDDPAATFQIRHQTSVGTILYSGAYASVMQNDTFYDCSKLNTQSVWISATNGSGQTSVTAELIIQDNMAVCP